MKTTNIRALLGISLLALTPSFAAAETWAYSTSPAITGTLQAWPGNLGLDFNVNGDPIVVKAFGAFNAVGTGTFSGDIQVGIFDLLGNLQGTAVTFVAGTNYSFVPGSKDVFQSVLPFVLGPGSYSVVAVGFSAADKNGNTGVGSTPPSVTDNGGGLISFVGSGRYNRSATFGLPATIDGGPVNRYDAGTFEFEAVPEPGTFLLAGAALAIAGLIRRRAGSEQPALSGSRAWRF